MLNSECCRELKRRLRHNWRFIVAIIAPIALSPLAWAIPEDYPSAGNDGDPNKKFRAAYVIMLMAVFWVLEVFPLAVTSLVPLILFPLLNVQDAASVSKNYMKESNMIFLGAIILALSIEYCGLHIRGALKVISIFGSNPARILMGTMVVAGAMSMWLSDTSCTTMLLPILSAITAAMFREEQDIVARPEGKTTNDSLGSISTRLRRESLVFSNSALQGHQTNSGRRSRRSVSTKSTQLNGQQSDYSSALDETTGLGDNNLDGRTAVVSSMSIIMEGVAVPTEEDQINKNQVNAPPDFVQQNIRKMLLFAVAYSASVGGTGSLVGTGPIKVFKELIKEYKLEKDERVVGITFATWMAFNIPPLIVNLFIVWVFLVIRYIGVKHCWSVWKSSKLEKQKVKEYLREEYEKLGPISAHEIGVLLIFIFVVLLWILRDPQVFPGWNSITESDSAGDSTAGMLGVILLFIVPRSWSFLSCKKKYQPTEKYEALLDWKFVSTSAPWGYILMIGSGYAIADASQKSQLSSFIGEELDSLKHLSKSMLLLVVIFLTSVITEVVSNTACASLILPVLFSVSCKLRIHPIYLPMASAVTASYAFMLPISSPPNAIIFATGELSIKEMLQNGLFLNFVCNIVLFFAVLTYGDFIFHFSTFKDIIKDHSCANFNLTEIK